MRVEDQHEPQHGVDPVAQLEAGAPPDRAHAAEVDTSLAHFFELAAVIDQLMSGAEVDLAALEVGELERRALAHLLAAATGRAEGRYVLAEDRLVMLNQALAVLQPTLAVGAVAVQIDTTAIYQTVVAEVGALRATLTSLTDAQEELFAHGAVAPLRRDEDDTPPDAPDAPDDDPAVVAPPSTLSDGPAVERVAAPSTLSDGPAVERVAAPSTLSDGPAVERVAAPSTLTDEPGA
jgi:hypothetical protein